jgi:hypothetical protein
MIKVREEKDITQLRQYTDYTFNSKITAQRAALA